MYLKWTGWQREIMGAMGKYSKEYEAFEIFEEIQNQKSREETVPQPLSQGRVRGLFSFEEAPYYEIEYGTEPDGGAVPGQGSFSISGSSPGSLTEEGKETGVKALKSAGTERIKGQQTEAETWKWGARQQTELEMWKREAAQQTEAETWKQGAAQHLNPESIRLREEDPVRQMFNQMRDIARESRYLNFRSSHFYNQKLRAAF